MRSVSTRKKWQSGGFSLLEMSVVLAIIGTIIGVSFTVFTGYMQKKELAETNTKMAAIQQALYNYRLIYNRIPCPADIYQATTAQYFGIEAGNPNTCHGSTPAADYWYYPTWTGTFTSGSTSVTSLSGPSPAIGPSPGWVIMNSADISTTTYISAVNSSTQFTMSGSASGSSTTTFNFFGLAEGMVPTKTLRLPDDYAFDGWGNRIIYTVDTAFTNNMNGMPAPFVLIPATDPVTTRMTVKDASGNAKTTQAIYVLVSTGPNQHGAFPRSGSVTRYNASVTNAKELANCNCNSSGQSNANVTGTFYQMQATPDPATTSHANDFDDIVVYGTRNSMRGPLE